MQETKKGEHEISVFDTDILDTQAVSGRQQRGVAATPRVLIMPHLPQWSNKGPRAPLNHPHHQCHLHSRWVETAIIILDIS